MVSYTPTGLKKLADTDAVALTAGVTRQHANSIQSGTATVQTVASGVASVTISFDPPFAETPRLIPVVHTGVPQNVSVGVGGLTAASGVINVWRNSATSTPVSWIAIGKGSEL